MFPPTRRVPGPATSVLAWFCICADAVPARAASIPAPTPTPTPAPPVAAAPRRAPFVVTSTTGYWLAKVNAFQREQARLAALPAADRPTTAAGAVVFVGDSLTERAPLERLLPGLGTVNRGIGGDKIGGGRYVGVLDRVTSTVAPLRPRAIVVMVGVNDIVFARTPPDDMDRQYAMLLETLRRIVPADRMVVVGVLPVRGEHAWRVDGIVAFNKRLRAMARAIGARWVDARGAMAGPDGGLRARFAADAIHLNAAGYRAWAKALRPALRGLRKLDQPGGPSPPSKPGSRSRPL